MRVVPANWDNIVKGDIQPLTWGAKISFDKTFDDSITFWTWDTSTWDGGDMWKGAEDNPIQAWDYYKYLDYSEAVESIAITHKLEFPYSVSSAIADFQLKNEDKYFTPNSTSPIASNILPRRPVRLMLGMGDTNLQQFVGLTEGMPEIDSQEGTASFTAMDFLTWIYDMPIRNTQAMVNVRTDEVLKQIFLDFGLDESQFSLQNGRNTIPFLFWQKDQQTAGDVIRPLMEAEMGMLWLDENGIIQFKPRIELPLESSFLLDSDSIHSLDVVGEDQIINRVIITAAPRELQEPQVIHSMVGLSDDSVTIGANSSKPINIELDDPSIDIVTPTLGTDSGLSWIQAYKTDGTEVNSSITISGMAEQTNSITLFIVNNNPFPVVIADIFIWGKPAKIKGGKPFEFNFYEDVSVEKYGEKPFKIDNNFIQNESQADALATTMIDNYNEYADLIQAEIKPNPALQLGDIIEIDYQEFTGNYRIMGINLKISNSEMIQVLQLRKYIVRVYWQWDISLWDEGIWAP